MRILQVHCRYREPGGEDRVVHDEAELLRSAGHEVVQYQVENPTGPVRTAANLAVAAWNPGAVRRLRQLARDLRPELAHVHNTWFSLSPGVFRAFKAEGVPVVAILHNYRLFCANAMLFRAGRVCTECVGASPWRAVGYRCYRGSAVASLASAATIALHRRLGTWIGQVDRLLVVSEFQRRVLVGAGVPEEKLLVHPNFVPDPGPRPSPPSASNVVLFVGRLTFEKGVDLLLDAWGLARPPGLELVVVGDGPLRAELEGRRVPGVRFTGPLPHREVTGLMLSSRALVFPSRWFEAHPRVVVEALAAGLPVLTSSGGAGAELVSDLGEAWVVSPSVSGLAEALATSASGEVCDWTSEEARAVYESRFTPGAALRRYLGLASELLSSVGVP